MRPEPCIPGKQRCSQKVAVYIADTSTVETARTDEVKNLLIRSNSCTRKLRKVLKHGLPVLEVSAGKFAPDEGMDENSLIHEKGDEMLVTRTKMVDPDGGIHQNHPDSVLRL